MYMSLPARESGKCVFCTFRTPTRVTIPLATVDNARSFGQMIPKIRRTSEKETKSKKSGMFGKTTGRLDKTAVPSHSKPAWRDNNLNLYQLQKLTGSRKIPGIGKRESPYDIFGTVILIEFRKLTKHLRGAGKTECSAWGIHSEEVLEQRIQEFKLQIESSTAIADGGLVDREANPLFDRFRRSFVMGSLKSLGAEVKFAFINSVVEAKFSEQDKTNQEKLADLQYPYDWFPATRALHRTIHLHVGPTNSGKTYHALKRLEAAHSGIYAGPLRLLAHEVYSRFNAKGKSCMLITGEERRIPEDGITTMSSCTVEMMPLNKRVEVAVIDEIQMMGDNERGWAWTQAFLGVQADEVHLCGELRTIQLVSDICTATGEKLEIHRYERLSPLAAERQSLDGDLSKLRKGDAVILFSRVGIHAMKQDVERVTGKRCAVVYGSLPPETRAQQAELFNNPDNDYDFLVASDAVGMGLNLSIKRIIFESTSKHDGLTYRVIRPSEIKQIAGRAGRYKTSRQAVIESSSDEGGAKPPLTQKSDATNGLVTTLERFDLPVVQRAMALDVEPLKTAGVIPPADVLFRFASYFPKGTPFSFIALRLWDMCKLGNIFHMCRIKDMTDIADVIEPYELSTMDRITLMAAPVALREYGFAKIVQEFAECVANQSGGELLDLKSVNLELIDMDKDFFHGGTKAYLRAAENLHKALTLYLWLSYRFAGVFRSQALAFHVKGLVEEKIDGCLAEIHFDPAKREKVNQLRMKALELDLAEQEAQRQAREGLDLGVDYSKAEGDGQEKEIVDFEEDFVEAEKEGLLFDEEESPASEANVPVPPEELEKAEAARASA